MVMYNYVAEAGTMGPITENIEGINSSQPDFKASDSIRQMVA